MRSVSRKYILRFFGFVLLVLLAACKTASTPLLTPTLPPRTSTQKPTTTETPQASFHYTVSTGDSCTIIAFNFDVSVSSIILLNNLQPSCIIKTGQQILVPYPTVSKIPTRTLRPIDLVIIPIEFEFQRENKKYTVIIENVYLPLMKRDLYETLTPPPSMPELPPDVKTYRAKIKEIIDLDNDGEQEYTILVNECTDLECKDFVSFIRIYKYDPEKDNYYIFDEFETTPEEIELKIGY